MSSREDLPTGTVTFFFSDVEGSTKLLQSLGGRYDEVITVHNRLMREVFERWGGRELGTEGDSFFVVFANARTAIEAAVDAQRKLQTYDFAEGVKVRVRMGIHTGEGRLVAGNYRGIDVHRAARIAAAAHGGQVLVSQPSKSLVQATPDLAVDFIDLGEHRLKDLEYPEHLYQLAAEGLGDTFPPVRTLEGRPNNLPAPVTSFIGRERELAELKAHLRDQRLITLTGTGGTGKSRIALRAGAELLESYRDGVFVVFLASVQRADVVPSAVAQALGLQRQGVGSPEDEVGRFLADKQMLLILDNFEHLLPAASFVAQLLADTQQLRILVTSRAALRISAEQEMPVPPMSLPDRHADIELQDLKRSEAVRLFMCRAHSVRPDFEITANNADAIKEICLRLDGLPLALELAAARVRTLDVFDVARRLNRSLDLLTTGSRDLPERQQTLRNTVAWSYELLSAEQRDLLNQLGVFSGGFSLEAAESVCCDDALDLLDGLVEQSLLKVVAGPLGLRYLLLEPVREYALERLEESGAAAPTRRRHAHYFLAQLQQAQPSMQTPALIEVLARLDLDHDNLRTCLNWAIDAGEWQMAAEMGWGMWMYWWLHGYHAEGRRLMETLLAEDLEPAVQAVALCVAGNMALVQGDHGAAAEYLDRAVQVARAVGDSMRLAVSLQSLGLTALNRGDVDTAVAVFEEALPIFTAADSLMMVSGIHTHLGTAALLRGDLEAAEEATRRGLAFARRCGAPVAVYFAMYNLAQVALAREDLRSAAPLLAEGLDLASQIGNHSRVIYFLESFATVLGAWGDMERAVRLLGAAAALRDAGNLATYTYLAPARRLYERTIARMRSELGAAAFDEGFAEGRHLTISQAVAFALEAQVAPTDGAPAEQAHRAAEPPVVDGALVGRRGELERLETMLQAAAAGRGRVVLIEGEPGIGKTRLAQEVVARARALGWSTATGGGIEGSAAPAFWPWSEVLGQLLYGPHAAQLLQAAGGGIAEVAQAIPAVAEAAGSHGPPLPDPNAARMRLFESVAAMLSTAARSGGLVIHLEDLQWFDAASLQLLGHAGRRAGASSLVILGTYRPSEIGRDHPLVEVLGELGRHQVSEHLELSGLDEAAVAQLITRVAGEQPDPEILGRVYERSGGNPLFVTELAALISHGSIQGAEEEQAIPAAVRDILLARVSRLTKAAAALISVGAVAGREFELSVARAAAGLTAEEVVDPVEEALRAGLVQEVGPLGRLRFSHDLIRETVLQAMTGARRAVLHGQVADALLAVHGDAAGSVELAHHFYEAAEAADAAKALQYVLRAAEEAAACFAYELAEEQLGNALDLVARLASGEERDRSELTILLKISSLLTRRGGFSSPQNGDVLARAEVLGKQLGETRQLVAVLYGLSIFETVGARYDTAQELAGQLSGLAEHSGDPAETMIAHLAQGIVYLHRGELLPARMHLTAALEGQQGERDPWLGDWFPLHPEPFIKSFIAWLTWLEEGALAAGSIARDALAAAEALGDPFTICHCLSFDIWMQIWDSQVEYVAARAAELREMAAGRGFPLYLANGVIFGGWALAEQGRPDEGSESITQGITGLADTGAEMLQSIFLSFLAQAQRRAGRPLEALAVVDQALKFAGVRGERFYEAELHRLRGEVLLELGTGERDRAREEFHAALKIAEEQGAVTLRNRAAASLDELLSRR